MPFSFLQVKQVLHALRLQYLAQVARDLGTHGEHGMYQSAKTLVRLKAFSGDLGSEEEPAFQTSCCCFTALLLMLLLPSLRHCCYCRYAWRPSSACAALSSCRRCLFPICDAALRVPVPSAACIVRRCHISLKAQSRAFPHTTTFVCAGGSDE